MRLRPNTEVNDAEIDDLDLSYIDDDPLNYFLTPAPSSQDEDVDMFDFDAGIENHKQPTPIVRSISPSKLDRGLNLLPRRPPTPPRSYGSPSPEPDLDMLSSTPDDVDEPSFFHFGSSPTSNFSLPFISLKDFAKINKSSSKPSQRSREKPIRTQSATLLSPHTPPSPRGRVLAHRPGPRPLGAAGMRGRSRTWSGRVSPHAWREPSPDVWAIEEETEEELNSEWGGSMMGDGHVDETCPAKPVDIVAAKPKKRVRFVLPAQDMAN